MAPPRSRAPIMRGPRAPRNRFTHPDAVAISRRLMRSVIGGLLVALLVAEPALAGSILYATAASQQRIDGFCLGADGALSATPTVQIPTLGRLPRRVLVGNGLLYVSADDIPGRIAIYRLNADGSLPQTGCGGLKKKDRPAVMRADSARKRLQRPKAFIVVRDFVYVEERSIHRLTAFRLQPDGTFCDKGKDANGNVVAESCGDLAYFLPTSRCARRQAKEQRQQCAASKTASVLQYEDLVLHPRGETLIGTQYFKGRLDAYRLKPEPRLPDAPTVRLPKQPTFISTANPVMTPVRLTAKDRAVYVAGGELDRVVAFRLESDGMPVDAAPFSRTDEQTNSFPNDVAVAMLSAACE